MGQIVTLENAARQKKLEQNKALAVELSSQIAIRCDKYESDITFPALCAVFAQQIKKRIHSTNFMNAIGQMAQEIHRMVFDPETQAQVQSIKEEVLVELDEITKNANRWIIFKQMLRADNQRFYAIDEMDLDAEVDKEIAELEEAAARVKKEHE